MKKGMKVRLPYFSNEIAVIDWIYPNGTVDIKYKGDSYVVSANIKDLVRA